MVQSQLHGVQGLAGKIHRKFATTAVGGIAHHWMIDVGTMHPNLMRSARIQFEAQ
jgi:acyl carrier protein phosphodiesterase